MKVRNKYPKIVLNWLILGLIMVFFQVVLGGITRLTESGLSITKWDIITGTLPPITEEDWNKAFEMYKATPQYKEINEGMSFADFKMIFFWEYIHRLWARIMGFVFLIPFIIFIRKKYIDSELLRNLLKVIFLSILAATFGWIMVASGLVNRPWVNAYKLSLHLMIAFSVYVMLLWTYLNAKYTFSEIYSLYNIKILLPLFYVFAIILTIQIFLGGVLSGMKAAVVFPTWPSMNGAYFPDIIFDAKEWNANNFNEYDRNYFMPSLIHFLHRNIAYLVVLIGSYLGYRLIYVGKLNDVVIWKNLGMWMIGVLMLQACLGILTVLNSQGSIPVVLGVLHQAGGMIILTVSVTIFFVLRLKKL